MKLVLTRDIANVPKLNLTPDKDQVHTFPVESPKHVNGTPKHLHKGTRVTIGMSEKADDLAPEEKEKILWLNNSKAIVPADDKAVARIDKEVKVDIERHKKESAASVSQEELIAKAVAKEVAAFIASQKK